MFHVLKFAGNVINKSKMNFVPLNFIPVNFIPVNFIPRLIFRRKKSDTASIMRILKINTFDLIPNEECLR